MSTAEELARQLAAEKERADNARLRALLRRGMRQLEAWQEKYGDWQPQWLPPAGDVQWAEDVSEALATPNGRNEAPAAPLAAGRLD